MYHVWNLGKSTHFSRKSSINRACGGIFLGVAAILIVRWEAGVGLLLSPPPPTPLPPSFTVEMVGPPPSIGGNRFRITKICNMLYMPCIPYIPPPWARILRTLGCRGNLDLPTKLQVYVILTVAHQNSIPLAIFGKDPQEFACFGTFESQWACLFMKTMKKRKLYTYWPILLDSLHELGALLQKYGSRIQYSQLKRLAPRLQPLKLGSWPAP